MIDAHDELSTAYEELRVKYDALRAAAGKVTCAACAGTGLQRVPLRTMGIVYMDVDCPDCADLRALLAKREAPK